MLRRRKVRVPTVAVFVLVAQLLLAVAGVVNSVYAISGPPPPADVTLHLDLDTAKGFESVKVRTLYPYFSSNASEFVLRQGATGTFNVTLTSYETNNTVIAALFYGGIPPFNYGWYHNAENIPDGITYSIEPANMTLAPNSTTTAVMRISAAPGTPVRSYNLTISFNLETPANWNYKEFRGDLTVLTIVEGVSPINNTTSTEKVTTTTYVTETATLTSTATTTTMIEGIADPTVYAWAISATTSTAVLVMVLLRRRRR